MLAALVLFAVMRVIAATPPFDPRAVFDGGIYDISAILTNALMLHGVGFEDHLTWNYPSWSISAEVWTYLIFALVWGLFALRSMAIAALLAIACPVLVGLFPAESLSAMTLVRVVGGFALGIVLRRLFLRTEPALSAWLQRWRLATLLEIGAVWLAVVFVLDIGTLWIAPYVFAVMVFVFALEAGAVSGVMRTPPLLTIGAVSYSIYMIHAALLMMTWSLVTGLERATGWRLTTSIGDERFWATEAWIGDLVVIGMVGVVIAVSMASYAWIEKPGQAWGQRAAERWKRFSTAKRGELAGETARLPAK